jgi:hypothetical protein
LDALRNCQYGRDGGSKLIKTAQSEESVRSGVVELRAVSNIDQFERGEGGIIKRLFTIILPATGKTSR